jgi:hypothetical protein
MPSVFFTFKRHSDKDARARLLKRLSETAGVVSSAPLSPESTHPEVSRIGFVEVTDDADVERLLEQLRQDPLVESADRPPQRKLV